MAITKEDLYAHLETKGIDKTKLNKDNITTKDVNEFRNNGRFSDAFYNQFNKSPELITEEFPKNSTQKPELETMDAPDIPKAIKGTVGEDIKETKTPEVTKGTVLVDEKETKKIGDKDYTYNDAKLTLDKLLEGGKIDKDKYNKAIQEINKKFGKEDTTKEVKFDTVADFKEAGGGMNLLEQWVEDKYGTVASQDGNKLVADIDGYTYEWIIDNEGNPIKKRIGVAGAVETADISNDKSSDDYFNLLKNGEPVGDTKTLQDNADYQKGKKRYQNYISFDKTDEGFRRGIKNGQLNNTELYQDLVDNGYGEQLKKIQAEINIENADLEANGMEGDGQTKAIADMSVEEFTKLVQNISGKMYSQYFTDFKNDWDNNETLNQDRTAYKKDYAKMTTLIAERNKLYDSLVAQYPGASTSYINALYNRQSRDLTSRINELAGNTAAYDASIKQELDILNKKYSVRKDIEDKKQNIFNQTIDFKNSEEQRKAVRDNQILQAESTKEVNEAKQAFDKEQLEAEYKYKAVIEGLKSDGDVSLTTEQSVKYNKLANKYINNDLSAARQTEQSNLIKNLIANGATDDQIKEIMGNETVNILEENKYLASAIDNVLSKLYPSKFKDKKNDFLNEVERFPSVDGEVSEEVIDKLKVFVKDKQADGGTELIAKETTNELLGTIKELFLELKEGGFEGLQDAALSDILDKVGKSSNVKATKAKALVKRVEQLLRKETTGAAFSEKEAKEYKLLIGKTSDTLENRLAKLEGLEIILNEDIDAVYGGAMGEKNYRVLIKGENPEINKPSIEGGDKIVHTSKKDGKTYTQNDLLYAENGTVIPTRLNLLSKHNTIGGMECGEYINDTFGTNLGNTFNSKRKDMDTTRDNSWDIINADIGDIVIWQPTDSELYMQYGHTGFITGEDGEYYIVKSSNLEGGTITERKVLKQSIEGKLTTDVGTKYKESFNKDDVETIEDKEDIKDIYTKDKDDDDENKFLEGVKGGAKWSLDIGVDVSKYGGKLLLDTVRGISEGGVELAGNVSGFLTDISVDPVVNTLLNMVGSDIDVDFGGKLKGFGDWGEEQWTEFYEEVGLERGFATTLGKIGYDGFASYVLASKGGELLNNSKYVKYIQGLSKIQLDKLLTATKSFPKLQKTIEGIIGTTKVLTKGAKEGLVAEIVSEGEATTEGAAIGALTEGVFSLGGKAFNKIIPKATQEKLVEKAQKLIKFKNSGISADVIEKQTNEFIDAIGQLKANFGDDLVINKKTALKDVLEETGDLREKVFNGFKGKLKDAPTTVDVDDMYNSIMNNIDDEFVDSVLTPAGITPKQLKTYIKSRLKGGNLESLYNNIKGFKSRGFTKGGSLKDNTNALIESKMGEGLDNLLISKLDNLGGDYIKFKKDYSTIRNFEKNIGTQFKKFINKPDFGIGGMADDYITSSAAYAIFANNPALLGKEAIFKTLKTLGQNKANPNEIMYEIFDMYDKIGKNKDYKILKDGVNVIKTAITQKLID